MLVDLETQGTGGHFLPALVVGYDVTGIQDGILTGFMDPAPDWLTLLSPQAGGLGISYPRVMGAVLRLEANAARGRALLTPFVLALRAMGESDDKVPFEPEFKALNSLMETHGDPYSAEQLALLNSIAGRYLDLPPFESGVEALVRSGAADPLRYLADWGVMTYRVAEGRTHPYTTTPPPYRVEESNVLDLVTVDEIPYRRIHEPLCSLARWFARQKEPGIRLLWENSD
ncbi:MAG TPA: hypothetical protein VNM14_10070 [Planctomycetota bacterium]|nr:hypothetical protein [Planctomycetota bacterium]